MDGNDPLPGGVAAKDSLPGHSYIWYTNGSKSEESSGASYYSRWDAKGKCMSLQRYATVLHNEVMVLLNWAQRLEDLNAEDRDISICSNRQAALRALAALAIQSRLIGKCNEALGRVAERNRLRLFNVPGHADIRDNEIADRLAFLGARSKIAGPEPDFVHSNKQKNLDSQLFTCNSSNIAEQYSKCQFVSILTELVTEDCSISGKRLCKKFNSISPFTFLIFPLKKLH